MDDTASMPILADTVELLEVMPTRHKVAMRLQAMAALGEDMEVLTELLRLRQEAMVLQLMIW